jgi:tight adherence protein C
MSSDIPIWATLSLLLCAASVALVSYVMLAQPLLEPPEHGLRGLKRTRARALHSAFASLEPWMRWLAARIAPLLAHKSRSELQRKIMIAGEVWGLWPAELRGLSVLSACAGAALGQLCVWLYEAPRLCLMMFACLGLMLPDIQLASAGRKRVRAIGRRIPHVVDMLVLSLGAGLDLPAALRQVVDRAADPESDVIEELGLVLEELKLGHTRRHALEQLASRAPCDEVRDLVSASVQSEEQGTPLGVVLQTQATTSRQRRSTRAEEAASKASTALVLPLLLIFVSLVILIIAPTVLEAMNASAGLGEF